MASLTKSWLPIPSTSHFGLRNIPFGIISTKSNTQRRPAIAIGTHALDLASFTAGNGFSALSTIQPHSSVFSEPTLNSFAALGRPIHRVVREYLQSIFTDNTPFPHVLKDNQELRATALLELKDVTTHLPMRIGDYTDFYAGLNHAFNVGCLFRGPENALQPNYKHLPVGYHGRASSVVVSGTPITRPSGQILSNPSAPNPEKKPVFSACKKFDIELELGCFVCTPNGLGEPVPIAQAAEHVFGVVLMNDWSARDIQAWEYVPLGPFGAKNFGTTISPWVVLADALEPFRARGLDGGGELLPYLREQEAGNYDIKLQVDLKTSKGGTTTVTRTTATNLLYSFPQMITHHTITGCNLQTGDLLGSGTISGKESGERGSLLEQNENGKHKISLEGDEERTFLEDGDTVTISGVCGDEESGLVGFGECVGQILPAKKFDFGG